MEQQIAPSMFNHLGGNMSIGQSMFGSVVPQVGPTTEELEKARERVMFKKHVETKGYHVKIFNMHVAKDIRAYEKLMGQLIKGTQARTHQIFVNEFELLSCAKGQQWHRYIEWAEFELDVQATAPAGLQGR